MLKALTRRSLKYLTGLTISKILTVLVFILVARILLPTGFGKLVLYITLGQIITFFGDFGLVQWYQKKAHIENREDLFNKLISARVVTLILTIVASFVFLLLVPTFTMRVTIIFLIALIPYAFLSVLDGFYFDHGRSLTVALKTISRMSLFLIGFFVFKTNLNFETIVLLYIVADTLTLLWFFPRKMLHKFSFSSKYEIRNVLTQSFPFAFLTLTSFAYARGDSIVINYTIGSAALGLYGAAYRFLESVSLIPTALSHNLFPESAKEGNVTLRHTLTICAFMLLAGILIATLLFFGANALILLLFGPAYVLAVGLIKIFSLVIILFFVSIPLNTIVLSSKQLNRFLPYGIGNTALNIILNILFVPIYGVVAAAWVMFATEVTGLIINIVFIRKVYKHRPL